MTIQEAIRSGKPFGRKLILTEERWLFVSPSGFVKIECGRWQMFIEDPLPEVREVKE